MRLRLVIKLMSRSAITMPSPSLSGGEADLGIQILSTHVRLLALDENADANATTAAPNGGLDPASGFVRTASGRKPALLLGAGVGTHAAIKQSVLILADDYAPGRNYYCETKRHRYKLKLKNALERHEQYVWASLSVAQIGSLGRPDA